MLCPKCGKENPDNVGTCTACNYELPAVSVEGKRVDVQISKMAVASSLCALVGLVCSLLLLVIAVVNPLVLDRDSLLFLLSGWVTQLAMVVSFCLGVAALVQISASAGRRTGQGFAVIGLAVPFILFLLVMWLPALAREMETALRGRCGANLMGIGKAMLIYADDYQDQLPRAGGPGTVWQPKINNWQAQDRFDAYGLTPDGRGGAAGISASLYLLIKYAGLLPNSFLCPYDHSMSEFKPTKYNVRDQELTSVWDFGPEPWKHCSYAYHMPYSLYALTTSSEPGIGVAADRGPWIDSPFAKARNFRLFKPDGDIKQQKAGNSLVHQEDGQNVLFMDGHVYFEKRAFCAINDDNIYTFWDGSDIRRGAPPIIGSQPQDRRDSLLVHDPPVAARK